MSGGFKLGYWWCPAHVSLYHADQQSAEMVGGHCGCGARRMPAALEAVWKLSGVEAAYDLACSLRRLELQPFPRHEHVIGVSIRMVPAEPGE